MISMRRQPPAYSPLSLGAVARAAGAVAGRDANVRPMLGAFLCRRYRADSAWLLGSGTQALQLGLDVARAAVGEQAPVVALPAFGCYDVATAAVGAGTRVTFYDIDPATLGPDGESLRHALGRDGAQILVASSLYGIPVDWDVVTQAAAECGAFVIEDAAQGLGACWRGEPLGSLAPISVLSFGRGKGWTGGAGGALLFRCRAPRPGLRLRSTGPLAELGVLARALAQALLSEPSWYGLPASLPGLGLGTTTYRDPRPLRALSRAAAAMLLETRDAAETEMAARRVTGTRLLAGAEAAGAAGLVHPPRGGVAGFLRFPLRRPGAFRSFPSPETAARLGVAPGYPLPLTQLAPLQPLKLHHHHACPGATELAADLVTLPTHTRLSAEEFQQLLGLLRIRGSRDPVHATAAGALDESRLVWGSAAGARSSRS